MQACTWGLPCQGRISTLGVCVKLDGFQMVISELEVEQDYLRRATRYLEG